MIDDSNNATSGLFSSAAFGVIYVYSVPNVPAFEGRVKIGDTTLPASIQSVADATQEVMEKAARKRIDSYTKTTDLEYVLEHVELAVRPSSEDPNRLEGFRDYRIHTLLQRNGIAKEFARKDKKSGEWFPITPDFAVSAIAKYKAHDEVLGEQEKVTIQLRPEQKAAVEAALKVFKRGSIETPKLMLWNAKMRFGKTITTYELVKELDKRQDIKRVLVITHRPDVQTSWHEDFGKSGLSDLGWGFSSKRNDKSWEELSRGDKFIWFASIQDLRGSYSGKSISDADFQKLKKNQELFATEFDLLVTDEAHEGNTTELSRRMTKELKASYMLDLSGTPFNLLAAESWDSELAARFNYEDNVYNWSYPDERKAKLLWTVEHPNEPNPYDELPEMKWITYDINETLRNFRTPDKMTAGTELSELFKVNTTGKTLSMTYKSGDQISVDSGNFVHEEQIRDLLAKIRGDKNYSSDPRLFPYNRNFENQFNHTLWMLPSVAACEAMKRLLSSSETGFDAYGVVNATGNGSAEWDDDSALAVVKKAIKTHKKTITLSYRMLTTGVTVKEWTAVFMFNNVNNPMAYMQTAFRAASPGSLADGRIKETAYVFDFNPDRCLRQIVETAKYNAPTQDEAKGTDQESLTQTERDEAAVKDYLNYISILSLQDSTFVEPDSAAIMDRLNEVYVNEVVAKGFDSPLLWNNKELMHFDIKRAVILESLRKMQGGSLDKRVGQVEISSYDEEARSKHEEITKKAREARNDPNAPQLTNQDKEDLKNLDKEKAKVAKTRKNAIGILVGIAARMPMLVFASHTDQRITPSNFAELIDEQSWSEFMPKNLKRIMPEGTLSLEERQDLALEGEGNILYWDDVKRFFNDEIFWRASERIRTMALEIESKGIIERKFRKDMLFTSFKRPDKETILTPARVVELQYTKTLGGLNFYDLELSTAKEWFVFTRNLETGEEETVEANAALKLLDQGSHELAPRWIPSDVDKVENDRDGFWEDRGLTIYDINSKTALYPLFAATSAWYANREAFYELNSGSNLTREELDNELWKDTVEKAIFLNVRVPYSASIAQRVLAGFDKKLAKASRENTTVVDVISLKHHVKTWNSIKKSERKDYWKPIEDEYDFIGKILRLANVGFMESYSGEIWNKLKQDENYVFLLNNLGKINEEAMNMDEFKKLKDLVDSVNSDFPLWEGLVGNPPYQIQTEGMMRSDAIYHHFMNIAKKISNHVSLIYPSRWMLGGSGQGLSEFQQEEADSNHYSKFFDFSSSEDIFSPPVSIAGGVNYFLWSLNKTNEGLDYYHDMEIENRKKLGDNGLLRGKSVSDIVRKIEPQKTMKSIVNPMVYYGESVRNLEKIKFLERKGTGIWAYGVLQGRGIQKIEIDGNDISKDISDWKLGVSKTAHAIGGLAYPRADRAFIAEPNTLLADSFLKVGSFSDKKQAENALRYIKTDFASFLLAIITPTQNTTRANYRLVPLVDFSTGEILDKPGTFLDFNKPETLDDQLAEIYGLTEEERELMRKDLKPWKDKIDVEADK